MISAHCAFDLDPATGEIRHLSKTPGPVTPPNDPRMWRITVERGRVSIDVLADGSTEQIGHAGLGNGTLLDCWSKTRLHPSTRDWTTVGRAIAEATGWQFSSVTAPPAPVANVAKVERRVVLALVAGLGAVGLLVVLFVYAWLTRGFPLKTGWDYSQFFGGLVLCPLLTIPAVHGLLASWNDPGLSTETVMVNGKATRVQRRSDGQPLESETTTKAIFVMLILGITAFALAFMVVRPSP